MHNEILLSHKKEHIWISSNEVDEPKAYYMEWSKSEREKQISLLAHIYGTQKAGTDEIICRAAMET